ncbi:FAD-dependent thymidylate synthase [Marine Group I thaumarchaeote]|uniref:Flavin-dependent thymidylate synthase n=1 Tax=Marine Group I thaumarchaeote TaxID=2511932 RepID=A0A7K4MWX8_9ARCH|nr:FAD-dependent thymidylate synthase [Marine Group I thaumarchaeote]
MEKSLGMKTIHQLGFVKLLDVMGDDEEIENSARISYGEGTRKVNQTRNLIRYLMRHKHTSPFEMCEVKFHLKLPIFIMRQLVRHRTANLNEYSGRYSVMSNEFYLPEGDYLAKQSTTNSQGRGEVLEQEGLLQFEFNRIYDGASTAYQVLLEEDLSRELARAVLPVANYTECIWKIDLHNFFHFVKLRSDSHAQREIRDYSDAMYELVKPNFPLCCEAFEDYVQGAITFSKQEMGVIRELLEYADTKAALAGMSVKDVGVLESKLGKRESKEFLEKLKQGDAE